MSNRIDRTGEIFNNITIIKFSHYGKSKKQYWICKCHCGKETAMRLDSVVTGDTKSCGCSRNLPRKDVYREGAKICGKCGIERPLSLFHKCTKNLDGYGYTCKSCVREQSREAYAKADKQLLRYKARQLYKISEAYRYKSRKRRLLLNHSEGYHTRIEFLELCEKYGNICCRCFKKGPLTEDHIIPLSRDGTDYIENIQPLCLPCNSYKSNKFIRDYRSTALVINSFIKVREVLNGSCSLVF